MRSWVAPCSGHRLRSRPGAEVLNGAAGASAADTHGDLLRPADGSDRRQALFLTTHEGPHEGPFSEFTVALDHLCLTVDSAEALAGWRQHLDERGVASSYQRPEWGHHINPRDPGNIAVELFLLEPDEVPAEILARAGGVPP